MTSMEMEDKNKQEYRIEKIRNDIKEDLQKQKKDDNTFIKPKISKKEKYDFEYDETDNEEEI